MSVPKIKNKILGHRKQAVIAYGKIKLLKLVLDETIITNEYIFLFKRNVNIDTQRNIMKLVIFLQRLLYF